MYADPCSHGVSLSALFDHRRFFQTDDVVVSACCTDHRRCRPGDLYVAVTGEELDCHANAQHAIDCGAVAILTERLLPLQVPQCIVPNAKAALGQLCQRLAGDPAKRISVVGIAGEFGTTATQMLLTSVVKACGQEPALFGNLGYTDGIESFPQKENTTSAARAATWLASVVANGCSHAITELTQPNVAQRAFDGVPLRSLLLTGFETGTHRNKPTPRIEAYLNRTMSQLTDDALVIANVDCPVIRSLVESIDRPVLTVSLEGRADVSAVIVEQHASEQTFMLTAGEDTAVVRTNIIGEPHIRHCLVATAAGLGLGFDLATIVGAVESIQKIPGYLERVECGQEYSVFSDASHTPHDLQRTLQTLRGVTRGKLICVFGQGDYGSQEIERGAKNALSARRGRIAERFADLGIITSDDPQDTEPLRATHCVLDGYNNPAKAHVMPNRIRAIEWALQKAQPGDTVLMAGSHNRHIVRGDDDFLPDADVARYWLYESAANDRDSDWIFASG